MTIHIGWKDVWALALLFLAVSIGGDNWKDIVALALASVAFDLITPWCKGK